MGLFSPGHKLIGIDTSDSSVRVVSLIQKGKKIILDNYYKKAFEKGYIQNGVIYKTNVVPIVKEALSRVVKPKELSSLSLGLPDLRTFTKFINLDEINKEDIEARILDEVRINIPVDLDASFYDYQIINYKEGKSWHTGAFIGVADRDTVIAYTSLIEESGYPWSILDIESLATVRSVLPINNNQYRDKFNIILDIGHLRSSLIAYKWGVVLFVVSIPITGDSMEKLISTTLEIDEKKSREAKEKLGLLQDKANGHIRKILLPQIDDLIKRIGKAQDFVRQHIQTAAASKGYADAAAYKNIIDIIWLTGGVSDLPGFKEALEEALHVEVRRADTCVNIIMQEKKIPLSELRAYGTAIGLALGLIN